MVTVVIEVMFVMVVCSDSRNCSDLGVRCDCTVGGECSRCSDCSDCGNVMIVVIQKIVLIMVYK